MNVTVLVASTLKGAVDGRPQLDLGVPTGASVGDLVQTLFTLYPKLRGMIASETRPRRQALSLFVDARPGRTDLKEARLYVFAPPADR